jgi:tetratricopeptide (TPR) repeat protein
VTDPSARPHTDPPDPVDHIVVAADPPLAGPELDELWDFDDPVRSETRFRDRLATVGAETQSAAELRTQLARALGLQGRFAEADAVLDDVEADLPPDPAARTVVRARLLLERGRVRNSSGSPAVATPLFRDALTTAECAGDDFLAADAAHMLAISDRDHAESWTREGLRIVQDSSDPRCARWAGSIHNNLGWSLHDAGDHDRALAEFGSALDAYRIAGSDEQVRIARWTVARGLRSTGRLDEALEIQTELADGSSDGYVEEELGELLLALGRPDEAKPRFAAAAEKLGADTWLVEHEPARIERLRTLGAPST